MGKRNNKASRQKNRVAKLPKGTLEFETDYGKYALVTKAANFKAAEKKAGKYGGHLAEVSSTEENQEIFDAITGQLKPSAYRKTTASDGGGAPYVWLGGSDQESEGDWIWQKSGQRISLDLAEWGSGALGAEPDNFDGSQNYLALGLTNWPLGSASGEGFGDAGSWNDVKGSNRLFYLLEFDK